MYAYIYGRKFNRNTVNICLDIYIFKKESWMICSTQHITSSSYHTHA